MSDHAPLTVAVPTAEFRSLPFPPGVTNSGRRAKLATFFVAVEDLPDELENWMRVNPRVPKLSKKDKLTGPVGKAMMSTLLEDPEKFALKNTGIFVTVDDVSFEKREGGEGVVVMKLTDPERHGLVNGGHTYKAIREARDEAEEGSARSGAYVRMHVIEGVEKDDIVELAEGLNRSMQVNNPSLENLKGSFDTIRKSIDGKPGHDQIAYRQGDTGEMGVEQVLQFMALFDLKRYPSRKEHPYDVFGHHTAVLERFVEDSKLDDSVFRRIVPRLHEILVLSDRIQTEAATQMGKIKVTSGRKDNRVGSARHKNRPAHFAGGTIGGLIHLGWLFPMLAAFRANVDPVAWSDEGKFKWIIDNDELLNATIGEMVEVIKEARKDSLDKPAEVGRKIAAYRLCYGILSMELASRGIAVQ